MTTIFGKRLKAERERKKNTDPKWTQEYVGNLVGVARPTYTSYENGTKEPPRETINKIADTFNVSIDYLEGRTDIRNYELLNGNHSDEHEIYIAYLGGPPEEIDEEEAEHLRNQLEMFRLQKEKQKRDREKKQEKK
ncbi:helix-turn-helix domain-containing protein [Paenibacillus sp. 2TAB19]|uniref:helix-turn-helix domain-containing protein n=1 Tax=Paenibacillus sp. 2TAB19 TaxID=3233003 RepID=UPI003F9AF054